MPRQSISIIPLRSTPYSDRHAILAAYSRELGPVSLLVPAPSASRRASRARALLMPLTVVEAVVDIRPGRDIHPASSFRPIVIPDAVLADPARLMTAQFLAELLGVVLREGQPDAAMWHFLTSSIAALNDPALRGAANFHICFIMGLARVIGIEPDFSTWRPGRCFDIVDARFVDSMPLSHPALDAGAARVAKNLARMSLQNMHAFRFTRAERNSVLDAMLDYFSVHYTPLRGLQSPLVFRSML